MKRIYGLLAFALMLFALACSKDAASVDTTGKSGSITRFAVNNGFMYVLNSNEVLTYNMQDPNHPELVNTLTTDYGLETILVYDSSIYLGSTTSLYILDISNPGAPVIASKTSHGIEFWGGCDPVAVKGSYAYSTIKIIVNRCGHASSQSALLVYDVSDKTQPVVKGTYPLSMPNGLGYQGNYLFVCDEGADKLEIFDVSDPLSLNELTDHAVSITDPVDLIVEGNKMIVSTKTDFQIYDLSAIPVLKKIGLISK
jgi:hypothetical protein